MPEQEQVTEQVQSLESQIAYEKDTSDEQDDCAITNAVIVPGPEKTMNQYGWVKADEICFTKTVMKTFENEKDMKKIIKEGGKRGVEIEGAADMGGLQFFCSRMEDVITKGNVYLLIETMKAMNAVSDPDQEERKGDSGKIGKMIFSTAPDETRWSAVAYIPSHIANGGDENQGKQSISAKEWLAQVVYDCIGKEAYNKMCIKTNEDTGKEEHVLVKDFEGFENEIPSKNWAYVQINKDIENGLVPMKIRDPSISFAYNYLKERDLFTMADDSDDDECCYGDDDLEW